MNHKSHLHVLSVFLSGDGSKVPPEILTNSKTFFKKLLRFLRVENSSIIIFTSVSFDKSSCFNQCFSSFFDSFVCL